MEIEAALIMAGYEETAVYLATDAARTELNALCRQATQPHRFSLSAFLY